jgi:hypothetical protein
MEEWRAVVGYEGLYEVSSEGRVRSLDRVVDALSRARNPIKKFYLGAELKRTLNPNGYYIVAVRRGNVRSVHSLVLESFVGPRPSGMWIRHLDGNSTNNKLGNLAYGTALENSHDKIAHGTMNYGTVNGQSKLNDEIVHRVRHLGLGKKEAAALAGCTVSAINYALARKTWKHVA